MRTCACSCLAPADSGQAYPRVAPMARFSKTPTFINCSSEFGLWFALLSPGRATLGGMRVKLVRQLCHAACRCHRRSGSGNRRDIRGLSSLGAKATARPPSSSLAPRARRCLSLAQPRAQCQHRIGIGVSGRVEFFHLFFHLSFFLFASLWIARGIRPIQGLPTY